MSKRIIRVVMLQIVIFELWICQYFRALELEPEDRGTARRQSRTKIPQYQTFTSTIIPLPSILLVKCKHSLGTYLIERSLHADISLFRLFDTDCSYPSTKMGRWDDGKPN